MEHYYTKKKYSRNISNIRRWRGPIPKGPPRASPPGTHEVVLDELATGDLLAITEDKQTYRLGRITHIVNDTFTLTMYGTTNPNIAMNLGRIAAAVVMINLVMSLRRITVMVPMTILMMTMVILMMTMMAMLGSQVSKPKRSPQQQFLWMLTIAAQWCFIF